jgi:septal ring factor EnvC (AmiA/AmiB activator)
MTFRTVVLPLGFGLSAVLCLSPAGADEDPAPAPRPPVRVYTNEDLDRVRPFRDETGVRSIPAVAPDDRPAPAEKRRGRGEDYWRREAARIRERVRAMEAQSSELRAEIAEQAEEASHVLGRRRRSSASLSGAGSSTRLRAKLASLERRMREMEEDLAERARRDGALPGWLRQ